MDTINFSTDSYRITPLRSSTIKTINNSSSMENIQRHFTYVTRSCVAREVKKAYNQACEEEETASICPSDRYLSSPNESSSSSEYSEPEFYLLPRLGSGVCGVKRGIKSNKTIKSNEIQHQTDEELSQEKPKTPKRVPMGTRVHLHPRFKKTRFTELECNLQEDLGPVCNIPLPQLFMVAPHPITIHKSSVTIETQTSPDTMSKKGCKTPVIGNRSSRQSNQNRRSSGAAVLNNLKNAFGSIRRAISAERLDQVSNSSNDSDEKSSIVVGTPKLRSKVLMSPKKFVRSRVRNSSSVYSPLPIINNNEAVEEKQSLVCKIVQVYPDGSKHIRLERDCLKTPFGFYISKDEDGIYVSKLGNAKATGDLWNLLRIGDRLRYIQGIDGYTADVASIKAMVKEDLKLDLIVKTAKH